MTIAKQPANSAVGNRSRDHCANCGPNVPEMTPPASTSEIAFDRNRSSAASAAAKRYCWANPLEQPIRNVPRQKSGNDAFQQARAAVAPPLAPSADPVQNPRRRPIRAINSAAGIVADIIPVICSATGKVDSALSVANMLPMIADTVARTLMLVIASAWHPASMKTTRREFGLGAATAEP